MMLRIRVLSLPPGENRQFFYPDAWQGTKSSRLEMNLVHSGTERKESFGALLNGHEQYAHVVVEGRTCTEPLHVVEYALDSFIRRQMGVAYERSHEALFSIKISRVVRPAASVTPSVNMSIRSPGATVNDPSS